MGDDGKQIMLDILEKRGELKLSSSETLLLFKFANLLEKNTSPGRSLTLTQLAQETGFAARTTQNALKSLMSKNLLLKTGESSPYEHLPNTYKLNVEALYGSTEEGDV